MQDFLSSSSVFLQQGSARLPIIIEPGDFNMQEDLNYEYAVQFTARTAFNDEVYTPTQI
jgi:hypothetical protein